MKPDSQTNTVYQAIAEKLMPAGRLVRHWSLIGGVSAAIEALEIAQPDGNVSSCVVRSPGGHELKARDFDFTSNEFHLLTILHAAGLRVPEPLLLDTSCTILPTTYLVMELITGSTSVDPQQINSVVMQMADFLAELHSLSTTIADGIALPPREDPINGALQYIPDIPRWSGLRAAVTRWTPAPAGNSLLHGDFWPGNVLWDDGQLKAVIDWEDAAIGDAISDLACARVELMVPYGEAAMKLFTGHYLARFNRSIADLPIWDVYVSFAALATMGDWGLEPEEEATRRELTTRFAERAGREVISR